MSMIVYLKPESGEVCGFCSNTWGLRSGRTDTCPVCERNYRRALHNWTRETMDKCAEVHMDQIVTAYYDIVDADEKRKEIYRLIEHYAEIRKDVSMK